jgi:hypothetical protein
MTTIAASGNATVSVTSNQQIAINSAPGVRCDIEATSGVAGATTKRKVALHPGGFGVYGPFGVGTVTLYAIGGAIEYDAVDPLRSSDDLSVTPSQIYGLTLGAGSLVGDQIAAPVTNLTSATGAAGSLTGAYYYTLTYVTAAGESAPWPGTATVVNPSSQQVSLTSIPLGPAGTIARRIYRTPATPTDAKDYRFLVEISDNTTTTYTDNTVDGSLGNPVSWNATNRGVITDGSVALIRASDQSTGVGYQAFSNNVGYASTAVGYQTLYSITTGRRNTAVGVYALQLVTTGYANTSMGVHAGNGLTTGTENTFYGYSSGGIDGPKTGSLNVALGSRALNGVSGTADYGNQNVALGYDALGNISATIGNAVGVGPAAGKYANANRQLFIDSGGDRTNITNCQNNGLIYAKGESTAYTQVMNLNAMVRLGVETTVANLGSAATYAGRCAQVTDSTVAYTSANIGATVAGGGANRCKVWSNGTNWVIG